jgi:hypothetical protein
MKPAKDQILEEAIYPDLATFLRSGGVLEIAEDFTTRSFARIRKGNKTVVVDVAYRDLAEVLKTMDSLVKEHFRTES